MSIINRNSELNRLLSLAARREGGFAVVWGRRRVGKTRLLVEWAARCNGIYFVADQSAPMVQRRYFSLAVQERIPGFADVTYPDWQSLLRRLSTEADACNWQGPLVIDEFPYLAAASVELPSILQHWIDHDMKKSRLCVAIAGSSQRMMQGLVLDGNAPLYGRATEAFELSPLLPGYISESFPGITPVRAVEHCTAWGGIPWYWEQAARHPHAHPEKAVDSLILDPHGALHTEPERLLLEELPPATAVRPILDVIGSGAHRLSEIAGRCGLPATSLSHPVNRLIEMGLVARAVPFGEDERKSKSSQYHIADPFMRLWFNVVAPYRGFLAQAPPKARQLLLQRHWRHLCAQRWEELSRQVVPRLTTKKFFTSSDNGWLPASRFWKGNGPEWDVVARSMDGTRMLLGEAKWFEKPAGQREIETVFSELIRKGVPPVKGADRCRIYHALFLPALSAQVSVPGGCCIVDAPTMLRMLK